MTALMRFIDRLRLRGAPEQVLEATRLYRDMRYDGMVMGNILGHAIHHDRDVGRLIKQMRKAEACDNVRLNALLEEVRRHHKEFARIRELDEPITRFDERGDPVAPVDEQLPSR